MLLLLFKTLISQPKSYQKRTLHAYLFNSLPYKLNREEPVDVGCGNGAWLSVFKKNGYQVFGIDGNAIDDSKRLINKEEYQRFDLEKSISLNKKFDLCMSLEVAEHLSPARASSFVQDLTSLGDIVLFSAAIEKQGGQHHINCQWQAYWADKFDKENYECIDIVRPIIWNNKDVEWWYKQNMLLYVHRQRHQELIKTLRSKIESKLPLDVVHPETYISHHYEPYLMTARFKKIFKNIKKHLSV